jgi:hypothetical protein
METFERTAELMVARSSDWFSTPVRSMPLAK